MSTPDQEATKKTELWDCVHPCALLVLAYTQGLMQGAEEDGEFERTFHAWGWMDDDGRPDVKRAQREYDRFMGPKFVEQTSGDDFPAPPAE